jgi:hypothetical protein
MLLPEVVFRLKFGFPQLMFFHFKKRIGLSTYCVYLSLSNSALLAHTVIKLTKRQDGGIGGGGMRDGGCRV